MPQFEQILDFRPARSANIRARDQDTFAEHFKNILNNSNFQEKRISLLGVSGRLANPPCASLKRGIISTTAGGTRKQAHKSSVISERDRKSNSHFEMAYCRLVERRTDEQRTD